ncbi:MAG: HypC/HybG/HupF family hydrogenase formation chaperone, partial [Acidimicrobiales bacterium]
AEAWGLTRLWLGAGPPGDAALAEHRCWFSDVEVAVAARSGRLMVLYHLLWELTHVVFEHPGLLHEEAACEDEVCITCSDEGRVAEVSEVRGAEVTATIAGRPATVDVTLLETVAPGDLILVHAGVALTRLGGSLSRPFQGSPR